MPDFGDIDFPPWCRISNRTNFGEFGYGAIFRSTHKPLRISAFSAVKINIRVTNTSPVAAAGLHRLLERFANAFEGFKQVGVLWNGTGRRG